MPTAVRLADPGDAVALSAAVPRQAEAPRRLPSVGRLVRGKNPLGVAPDDARAVAEVVRRLEDPGLRERLVAAGCARELGRAAAHEQPRLVALPADRDARA